MRSRLPLALAFAGAAACELDDRNLVPHPGLVASAGSGPGDSGGTSGGSAGSNAGGTSGASSEGAGGSQAGSGASGSGGSAGSLGGASGSGGSAGSFAGTSGSSGSAGTGGAGPGTVLYFEDFEDGVADGLLAGVDSSGDPFGTWGVTTTAEGSYFDCSSEGDMTWVVGGDTSWTDQRVAVDFQFLSIDDVSSAGVIVAVRFEDFQDYVRASYVMDGYVSLDERDDGSGYGLGFTYRSVPVTGTWYRLAVVFQGETISVYVNDELYVTGHSFVRPNGGFAFGARGATVRFDNVRVTVP